MKEYHRPHSLQTAAITYTSSDALPDMRTVTSATFRLRNPDGNFASNEDGTTRALAATISSQTQESLVLTHDWDPDLGEAQTAGVHTLIANFVTNDGDIDGNPVTFRIKEDWETLNN